MGRGNFFGERQANNEHGVPVAFVRDSKVSHPVYHVERGNKRRGERTLAGFDVGIGKEKKGGMNPRELSVAVRKMVRAAIEHKIAEVEIPFASVRALAGPGISNKEIGRIVAENIRLANYSFHAYKTSEKDKPQKVWGNLTGKKNAHFDEALQGFEEGRIIGTEMNYARDLINMPSNDLTPAAFAEAAEKQFKGTEAVVKVLGLAEIHALGMDLVETVSKGSEHEPKFVIVEYWGAGKEAGKPTVVVGKGVTFDTGGVSLKANDPMIGMEKDMAGGASVLAATAAIAKMGVEKNVVAIVPMVENAISGKAAKPTDIVHDRISGKKIQILNTDAEGRLILANGVTYAIQTYEPKAVIDVATLTGAALAAIGKHGSIVMSADEALKKQIMSASRASGNRIAELPLEWEEYGRELIEGSTADISNIPPNPGHRPHGGALHGGAFIKYFVDAEGKDTPFAHIDMATRSESIPSDYLEKGATAEPASLLVRFLETA